MVVHLYGWMQLCEREFRVLTVWEVPVSCILPFTEMRRDGYSSGELRRCGECG